MTRLRERTNGASARIANLVHRVVIKATSDVLRWATQGYDEDDDEQEVFQGIGFASRPPDGINAESVAVGVNGFDNHIIIATRDPETLRRVVDALGLGAGETLMFSTGVAVKCTGSKILAKSLEGAAQPVAFKSELTAVQARLDTVEQKLITHLHQVLTLGNPTGPAYAPPAVPGTPIVPTTPVTINGSQVLEVE